MIQRLHKTGWLTPLPDLRDYTEDTPAILDIKDILRTDTKKLPTNVDLRKWCSPIENQGKIGSCTAQAAVGIIEYFERRAFEKYINGSRLFVYKTTRNLMKVTEDAGAWLRNTMAALVFFGLPPEEYWPYTDDENEFNKEPSAFIYALADNYQTTKYFTHDPWKNQVEPINIMTNVKKYLAAGIPSMFGFYVFPSFKASNIKGGIPYPCSQEKATLGHAVVAVGYDDNLIIENQQCNEKTKGALLIRNSWGAEWGNQGYGWLPYAYVLNKLALDFWSMLDMKWIDTQQFGL